MTMIMAMKMMMTIVMIMIMMMIMMMMIMMIGGRTKRGTWSRMIWMNTKVKGK